MGTWIASSELEPSFATFTLKIRFAFREQVFRQISRLPFAPSVQMHEVPGESLGEHLGMPPMALDENSESQEVDEKLGRTFSASSVHRSES